MYITQPPTHHLRSIHPHQPSARVLIDRRLDGGGENQGRRAPPARQSHQVRPVQRTTHRFHQYTPRPPKRGAKPPGKQHPLASLKGKPTRTALDVSDSDDSLMDSDAEPLDDDPLMDSDDDSDLPPLADGDDDSQGDEFADDNDEVSDDDEPMSQEDDVDVGPRDALADALDSDDEPPPLTKAERKAAALDRRAARKQAAAAAEAADMQTNLGGAAPESEEDAEEGDVAFSVFAEAAEGPGGAVDLSLVQRRLKEVVRVLEHFQSLREPGRSRAEYVQLVRGRWRGGCCVFHVLTMCHFRCMSTYTCCSQLQRDLCTYHGFNDFMASTLLALFPPAEVLELAAAIEQPRPVTLRTNTLKTRRRDLAATLINRGVNLDPIGAWSKVRRTSICSTIWAASIQNYLSHDGVYITIHKHTTLQVGLVVYDSQVPVGATPEYMAGHYMLQSAASFLPVMALAPAEGMRVVDVAAAPGGKTTYIAALMRNTGVVFANEVNKARTKSLLVRMVELQDC